MEIKKSIIQAVVFFKTKLAKSVLVSPLYYDYILLEIALSLGCDCWSLKISDLDCSLQEDVKIIFIILYTK